MSVVRAIGCFVVGLIALAATAATIGLFHVGNAANWTSDGPGMLLVMIMLVVCAVVAFVAWIGAFAILGGGSR